MKSSKIIRIVIVMIMGLASWFCVSSPLHAQTDEIQVYTGEINKPREFSITLHNNFIALGRSTPGFPDGLVPRHSLNGVPEFGYGVTDWFELGAYVPVYSITEEGHVHVNAFKLRTLFVSPHANERKFFYGANFEFSYNRPQWDERRFSGEIRPIIGTRVGKFDFIFNPIFDYNFYDIGETSFVPALRVAYNLSPVWAVALEHYADFGQFKDFGNQQAQSLFGVVDFNPKPYAVEFGIGHGFTADSDALVLKLIVSRNF
ncbi:MAG: hypothetical protein HQM15_07345 [Deltaproteobacteria bacterium]|nr:hypothetical protein [Deltaproteobacteria bacterium]